MRHLPVSKSGQEVEQLRRASGGLLGVLYLPGRRRGFAEGPKGLEVRSEDRRTKPVLTETGIQPQLAQSLPSLPPEQKKSLWIRGQMQLWPCPIICILFVAGFKLLLPGRPWKA